MGKKNIPGQSSNNSMWEEQKFAGSGGGGKFCTVRSLRKSEIGAREGHLGR